MTEAEEKIINHLARIDNALRYLVKHTAFPNRNAFDDLRHDSKAMMEAARTESEHIETAVERIMGGVSR